MPPASTEFEALYESFKRQVFNLTISYLQNQEDAEEITQDVFLEVYRSMEGFKDQSAVSTWIYRITINKCLDFIKYKNRKRRFAVLTRLFHPETGALVQDPPDFHHPGIALEQQEKSAILFKAIDQLPDNQKSAFLLSKVEGLGNKEISAVMEMSVGAVESLLQRAKENLRKLLADWYKNE